MLYVLNDCHLGAIRTGGTTPASGARMMADLQDKFHRAVTEQHLDCDLLINGDLFDTYQVPYTIIIDTFKSLQQRLEKAPPQSNTHLILASGNHDLSTDSSKRGSFQLLAAILEASFPTRVQILDGSPGQLRAGFVNAYCIPHVANQDRFDLELSRVPPCDYLFVHANWDNEFAEQSDHSLNISKEQAEAIPAKHIIFAHVHQQSTALGGKVVVVGNQWPTSVADCLGNSDKRALLIDDEGQMSFETTWESEGSFQSVDWRHLDQITPGIEFIRVHGKVEPEEAHLLVEAVAKLRKSHPAYVITNSAKVNHVDTAEQDKVVLENIKAFDPWEALKKFFTKEQLAKVEPIYNAMPRSGREE